MSETVYLTFAAVFLCGAIMAYIITFMGIQALIDKMFDNIFHTIDKIRGKE